MPPDPPSERRWPGNSILGTVTYYSCLWKNVILKIPVTLLSFYLNCILILFFLKNAKYCAKNMELILSKTICHWIDLPESLARKEISHIWGSSKDTVL